MVRNADLLYCSPGLHVNENVTLSCVNDDYGCTVSTTSAAVKPGAVALTVALPG